MKTIKVTYTDKSTSLWDYSKQALENWLFISENSKIIVSIEIY